MSRLIRIEFTRPKNKVLPLFSYAIRAAQMTSYSHVRLRWKNASNMDVIYEASGTEVHFIGTLAQKDHQVYVIKYYEIDLDNMQYRGLLDLCMEYAGIEYGVMQIFGIALTNMLNLKHNPLSTGKYSQVCSELVGRFLEEVMKWDTGLNLDIAGPKEIDEFLYKKCKQGLVRYGITPG